MDYDETVDDDSDDAGEHTGCAAGRATLMTIQEDSWMIVYYNCWISGVIGVSWVCC